MATFEFIDNGKSFRINFSGQQYTAGKNLVELVVPDDSSDEILEIRSKSAESTKIIVNVVTDTITGVGAGSSTATELRDALEAIFFLDDVSPSGSLNQDQIIYVAKAGSDSNSGLNINEPKLTIQEAILDAILLTPSVSNQITIEVVDTGDYTDAVNLPEWVHLKADNASLDGILDVSDNCIVSFRRCQRTTAGGSCIKKTTGTGFAKISVELLIVTAGQNGLLANSGVIHIDAGVITIDGGIGIKGKDGSRVSFIVSEIQLSNGGVGIGTVLAGGDPNSFSGNVLYAKDDGTGVLLESRVSGDVINIQGGSFIVNTLFDMGINSTLNVFATESVGVNRLAHETATINATLAGNGSQTIARSMDTQALSIHDGTEPTETVVDFGSSTSLDFSIVNGIVTVLVNMTQVASSIEIHLIKTGGQVAEFDIWLEASGDSGVTWVAIDDSMRREVVDKDGATNFVADFSFNVPLPIGGMFRVVATNTGNNTLSMQAPPTIITANGGATGFAKKLRLIKLK